MIIYSDSPFADTGFATVVRNIVDRYTDDSIRVFGINHFEHETKYADHVEVVPAITIRGALAGNANPYGYERFSAMLALEQKPDVLLTILDPQVATNVLPAIKQYQARGGKWIAYWPIDSHVVDVLRDVIVAPDEIVFYTQYGKDESVKLFDHDTTFAQKVQKERLSRAHVIPHGVDSKVFRAPVDRDEAMKYRKAFLDDPRFDMNEQTQLFVSVNRNQPRKNYAQLIRAFATYQKTVEANSRLFLHCANEDTLGKIDDMAAVYGLKYGRDVILPKQDEDTLSADRMFIPYFCADAFVTTTLGEGWGLTISEAAACGLPVVAPRNSCIEEVLAPYAMQFMYEAKIPTLIGQWDMYRTRYSGWDEDVIEAMKQAIEFRGHHAYAARTYAQAFEWNKIVAERWAPLFNATRAQIK
jgi:glycosyltransferase involved in cell wall biosynthesis